MAESAVPLPLSAQEVAITWVEAVMDNGNLDDAWPLTDPTLRLVLVQDWIWAHRHHAWVGSGPDWDGLARSLSEARPDHNLWPRFSTELLELWQKIWRGFSVLTWQPVDSPEVVALDLETVTFVEVSAVGTGTSRSSFSRRFALRHTADGWRVASINGEQMFVPGWPPSMEVRAD